MTTAEPRLANRRILIVDDNKDVADACGFLLEYVGATVCVEYSGSAGIKAIEDFSPELILLDLSIPGTDGYETAILMRPWADKRGVKIVAVTAWPPAHVSERVKAAGFDGLLLKPVSVDDIACLLP